MKLHRPKPLGRKNCLVSKPRGLRVAKLLDLGIAILRELLAAYKYICVYICTNTHAYTEREREREKDEEREQESEPSRRASEQAQDPQIER